MSVYVAIPTYNRKGMLDRCLTCFEVQDTPPELVVVCNATSTDGTEEMLAKRHPNVLSLRCTDDNWWTGTINVCIREILRRCKPDDYILCINDDMEFGSEYVGNMLAAVSKSPKRAVGSVMVDIDDPDVIYDGGAHLDLITAKFIQYDRLRKGSEFARDHEAKVNVLSGRGVIYPVRAFTELGLFAPELLSLGADYEFALRCGRAGYELVVNYGCVVMGDVNPTSLHHRRGRFTLSGLKHFFTSPRSTGNLRDRMIFARLVTNNKLHTLWLFGLTVARSSIRYVLGPKNTTA